MKTENIKMHCSVKTEELQYVTFIQSKKGKRKVLIAASMNKLTQSINEKAYYYSKLNNERQPKRMNSRNEFSVASV